MPPSNEPSKVAVLRELQERINKSINGYLSAADDPSKSTAELARVESQIWTAADILRKSTIDPMTKVMEVGWMPCVMLCVRTAIDLNLFALVDSDTTVDQLHQRTGADCYLLQRIMRLLAAEGWFREVGEDCFAANDYSRSFVKHPSFRDNMKMSFDSNAPVLLEVPSYLASLKYGPVKNGPDTPARRAFGKGYFEHLADHPDKEADFASAMRIQLLHPPGMAPEYPFAQYLSPEQKPDLSAVSIVDVGGGQGQWLENVLKKNPFLREAGHRLILQDLPTVIANLERISRGQEARGFEFMTHDFFKPQPVIGAHYYHLRGILHDWPDEDVVRILKNLQPAFRKHSKLLITGWIVPPTNCPLRGAWLDIGMMTLNGSERSEKHYQQLFREAGFKMTGLTRPQIGHICVLEAQLAPAADA